MHMGMAPLLLSPQRRRVVRVVVAATVAAAFAAPAVANAQTVSVASSADLTNAVNNAQPGDTIQIADGSYGSGMSILHKHWSGTVTVTGSKAVRLAGLTVRDVTNLHLVGMTLAPPTGMKSQALLTVRQSSNVDIDGLSVNGMRENAGAGIDVDASNTNVTLENSDLTNCGENQTCVLPGGQQMQITHNAFHDCLDCDFVRGIAAGVTIDHNTFDRAVQGSCTVSCNHNDHVQVLGGGPWTIEDNRFGDRNNGAASVYLSTATNNTDRPVHDMLVADNLFSGDAGLYAVELGGLPGGGAGYPTGVTVANNTILSGTAGGVLVLDSFAPVPPADQPVIANNVMAVNDPTTCQYGTYVSNLVQSGATCSASDVLGAANLDANGRPTITSNRLVDKADPTYAPAVDMDGNPRVGLPDRGAYEWNGGPLDTTPPTQPLGLALTSATQSQLVFGWSPSSDLNGVASYDVSLNGVYADSVGSLSLSDLEGHLACGTTYQVSVTATDVAGNVSSPASTAMTTAPCADVTPPTVAITNATTFVAGKANNEVDATASYSDDQGVKLIKLLVDGKQLGKLAFATPSTGGTVTVTGTGSLSKGTHQVTLIASDGAGNSTTSAPFTITV
jgi:hypothetical protein